MGGVSACYNYKTDPYSDAISIVWKCQMLWTVCVCVCDHYRIMFYSHQVSLASEQTDFGLTYLCVCLRAFVCTCVSAYVPMLILPVLRMFTLLHVVVRVCVCVCVRVRVCAHAALSVFMCV